MAQALKEQLVKYLEDAHAIEVQALAQLKRAPGVAQDSELATIFEEHVAETEEHERLVRGRLEDLGAETSPLKDLLGRVSGVGFLLFARLQPDTPGKLAAHAYSYEAMEFAAYDMLERFAKRADDAETAEVSRRIRAQEDLMRKRLQAAFDRAVAASLHEAEGGEPDMHERLVKYLADMHALEGQAVKLLEKGASLAGPAKLKEIYAGHLEQTYGHARLVEERLRALDSSPNRIKDAALKLGALNWGLFFQAQPDTPHKLAAFAYAFEHLETAAYEELRRIGERAEDAATVTLAQGILAEEQLAAERIYEQFDEAVEASLRSQEVLVP